MCKHTNMHKTHVRLPTGTVYISRWRNGWILCHFESRMGLWLYLCVCVSVWVCVCVCVRWALGVVCVCVCVCVRTVWLSLAQLVTVASRVLLWNDDCVGLVNRWLSCPHS